MAKTALNEFNDLIKCYLCNGYLIDATTIVECLHSFCKTCIINHIDSNTPKSNKCPHCELQIHKTKPKLNIRSDPTLQDIVYKLVPGLFKNEMSRRREFYAKEKESAVGLSSEERGEMSGERLIFTPEDTIYLSIEYFPQMISYSLLPFSKCLNNGALEHCEESANALQRRYLRCQGGMRVLHLKKWIKLKYDAKDIDDIEIMYKHDPLLDEYSMIDLAYIYSWRRNGPLCLYYKFVSGSHSIDDTKTAITRPARLQLPVKRVSTVKHRHKTVKKKKNCVLESNLITTNPVNEPLPPVDNTAYLLFYRANINGLNGGHGFERKKETQKREIDSQSDRDLLHYETPFKFDSHFAQEFEDSCLKSPTNGKRFDLKGVCFINNDDSNIHSEKGNTL